MLVAINHESTIGLSFDEILDKVAKAKGKKVLSFSKKKRQEEIKYELPLPDDFFKDLEPLNDDEEKYLRDFMDSKLKEALKLAYAKPEDVGLSLKMNAQGVTIHTKETKDSNVNLVRARTEIPMAADLFMYAALAPTTNDFKRIFTMLDPYFKDGKVLYSIPKTWTRYKPGTAEQAENINLPYYSVKWAAYALPFPLYYREVVFCELTTWADDGSGVSMCMTIPKIADKIPKLYDSHGLVRGKILNNNILFI